MAKGIFITGTDTGVGKTVIACALSLLLKQKGMDVGVMKPIETGCKWKNGKLFPEDGSMLKRYSMASDNLEDVSPCRFSNPLAPMAAEMIEKRGIDLKKIKASFERIREKHDFMIIEGIGGLLVPIKKNFFVSDLAKFFGFPLLIVCHPGLGTLNHTFLTVREGTKMNLFIKGIIINNYNSKTRDIACKTNPAIINKILKPKNLIAFPKLNKLNSETLLRIGKKYLMKLADIL